jgi:hypothetical protein
MQETLQLHSVMNHPAFQSNPMDALQEHIANTHGPQ